MNNETLKKRREIVKSVSETGLLSISNLADFFNLHSYSIEKDIESLKLEENSFSKEGNSILLQKLSQKRDDFIDEQLNKGISPDEFLPKLGLYAIPLKERSFSCEEEKELFHGASIMDLAIAQDTTKIRMRKRLRELGIEDPEGVIKEGEQFRRQIQANKVKALIAEGVGIKDAKELIGLSEHYIEKIHSDIKTTINTNSNDNRPLAYKNAERRNKIYELYNEGMTQQEIADLMQLTRSTVSSDLKQFYKEHPEAKDKTILWRQRNIAEDARLDRRSQKEDVLFLRQTGLSPTKIAQVTKLPDVAVRKYLDEEGMLGEYISPRRALVKDLMPIYDEKTIAKQLGYNIDIIKKDIADINKLTDKYGTRTIDKETMNRRAEELKLSWQGSTTTEIMGIMGRNRANVLRDQHITSNFLRNNNEALKYVEERNGDVFMSLEK